MPLMCDVCKSSVSWNKEDDSYPCNICEVEDTIIAQSLKLAPRLMSQELASGASEDYSRAISQEDI